MTIARASSRKGPHRGAPELISARDLMIGKLVGVGLAGLTQLTIWTVVGLTITSPAMPVLMAQVDPFTSRR
jgi:ABC-type Na+ efflux pump permease subunit